jgi:hypothetical protein
MGAAGRARVLAHYTWARILEQYQALWAEQIAIRRASRARAGARSAWSLAPQASMSRNALDTARVELTALGRASNRVIPVHAELDAHIDPARIDALLDALAEGPRELRALVDPDDAPGLWHALFLAKHGFVALSP